MRRRVPTVAEAIPRALVGLAPNSRDLYAYYLQMLAERHVLNDVLGDDLVLV